MLFDLMAIYALFATVANIVIWSYIFFTRDKGKKYKTDVNYEDGYFRVTTEREK